jgi:hypothetical protein
VRERVRRGCSPAGFCQHVIGCLALPERLCMCSTLGSHQSCAGRSAQCAAALLPCAALMCGAVPVRLPCVPPLCAGPSLHVVQPGPAALQGLPRD